MASIKSILAAVDRVTVNDRRVSVNHHHGVKIAGWFRSAGFDRVETVDLALVGRLGRIEASVTVTTTHSHSHDAEGNVTATAVATPTWEMQCSLPGLTAEELQRTVRSLGCAILD